MFLNRYRDRCSIGQPAVAQMSAIQTNSQYKTQKPTLQQLMDIFWKQRAKGHDSVCYRCWITESLQRVDRFFFVFVLLLWLMDMTRLRYLKGTQEYDIHYTRDLNRLGNRNQDLNTLWALLDYDFAVCYHTVIDTARSASWNVILMNAGALALYRDSLESDNHSTFAQLWQRQLH